jgi:hypothetical protein
MEKAVEMAELTSPLTILEGLCRPLSISAITKSTPRYSKSKTKTAKGKE